MDKNVLLLAVGLNEPEPLRVIEPLDLTFVAHENSLRHDAQPIEQLLRYGTHARIAKSDMPDYFSAS
jgi:hypothetical protein